MQLESHTEFYNAHCPAPDGLQAHLQHHARSAMERLALHWRKHKSAEDMSVRLRTQYRMHEAVCQAVDGMFYGKSVRRAPPAVAAVAAQCALQSLQPVGDRLHLRSASVACAEQCEAMYALRCGSCALRCTADVTRAIF